MMTHQEGVPIPVNNMESAPGAISYHLLNILSHLTNEDCALTELFGTESIKSLITLLSLPPRPINTGLVTMQRQIIRALSKLFSAAIRTPKWVAMLSSQVRLFETFLLNLCLPLHFSM